MKNLAIVLLFLSVLTACSAQVTLNKGKGTEPSVVDNGPRQTQHKAMHFIVFKGEDTAFCTATAVSPHVLLTAAHCDESNTQIYIDQKKGALNKPSEVSAVYLDHHDHLLLVLPNENFKAFIHYSSEGTTQGAHVFFYGNPNGITDIYREGYIAGQETAEDKKIRVDAPVYLMAAPTVQGDSGAAIFDVTTGNIVGVITYAVDDGQFAGFYALDFSQSQLHAAGVK
jgi:hypothetical protein